MGDSFYCSLSCCWRRLLSPMKPYVHVALPIHGVWQNRYTIKGCNYVVLIPSKAKHYRKQEGIGLSSPIFYIFMWPVFCRYRSILFSHVNILTALTIPANTLVYSFFVLCEIEYYFYIQYNLLFDKCYFVSSGCYTFLKFETIWKRSSLIFYANSLY